MIPCANTFGVLSGHFRRTALAALAGLGMLAAVPAPPSAADFVWGVNGHPFTAYPGVSYTSQLDLVRDLGARSYRVNVSSTEHIERLRDLIALGARRGVEILPVLTPPFDLKANGPETLYANSFNFAFAVASAVRRHVRTIELGNELENYAIIKPCERQTDGQIYSCSHGLGTGIATTDYEGSRWKSVSAVLKGLSDGTIAADPTMRKAIGSAGWGHTGVFDLMQADGIRWDISVWHSYQQDPAYILQKVADFKKPIWITEFNYPTKIGGDPADHVKGLQGMIEALKPKLKRFQIEAVYFYELLDEPYWGADTEAIYGLATLKRTEGGRGWEIAERKPVFDVVKDAIADTTALISRDCDLDEFTRGARQANAAGRIEFAYCLVLGRWPEPEATENWSKALVAGHSIADLIVSLSETDEFYGRHLPVRTNNNEFLRLAYGLLLGRKPDGGGMQSFMAALNNGDMRRQDILKGMVLSSEFANRYQSILTRTVESR